MNEKAGGKMNEKSEDSGGKMNQKGGNSDYELGTKGGISGSGKRKESVDSDYEVTEMGSQSYV